MSRAVSAVLAIALTVLAAGCAGRALGPADLAIVLLDTRPADERADAAEIVRASCAVWGLTCDRAATDQVGAVVVVLTTEPAPIDDRALSGQATWRPCRPRLWSIGEQYTLAHELGHALGLRHVHDPQNVMFRRPGLIVDVAQAKRVAVAARMLRACPGSDPIVD